jgi:hypothetical protein
MVLAGGCVVARGQGSPEPASASTSIEEPRKPTTPPARLAEVVITGSRLPAA